MKSALAVLLPTRNREKSLRRVLGYLRDQHFKDFVVRVSDNGSTDGTRYLSPSDFPDLRIIWNRRDPALPGLAEHYQTLVSECQEEFFAVAHDDEIYSRDWLAEIVSPLNQGAVAAFGRSLNVDARGLPWRFHFRKPYMMAGAHTVSTLREELVTGRAVLCGNGFALRTEQAQAASTVLTRYEQYDFEWILRVAEAGITGVSDRYLNTHMVHPSNTLSSPEYLVELGQRIHACTMIQEWMDKTPLSEDYRARRHADLAAMRLRGLRHAIVKATLLGSKQAMDSIASAVRRDPLAGRWDRLATDIVRLPYAQPLGRLLGCRLECLRKHKKRRIWPNRLSEGDLEKIFPECIGQELHNET